MMIVRRHRLEGPSHVFRTCTTITSLYASPSLASHTEPSEVSHMLDAGSNGKRRYAQNIHSIDHRMLARSTTPTSFRKALNFQGITRKVAPRGAGNQTVRNRPGRLWISKPRLIVVPPMETSSGASFAPDLSSRRVGRAWEIHHA